MTGIHRRWDGAQRAFLYLSNLLDDFLFENAKEVDLFALIRLMNDLALCQNGEDEEEGEHVSSSSLEDLKSHWESTNEPTRRACSKLLDDLSDSGDGFFIPCCESSGKLISEATGGIIRYRFDE